MRKRGGKIEEQGQTAEATEEESRREIKQEKCSFTLYFVKVITHFVARRKQFACLE